MTKNLSLLFFMFAGLLLFAGCSSGSVDARVSGNIVSNENATLPEGAVIQVQIQDVSKADAAASVIGEQIIDGSGKTFAIPYEVTYDSSAIDDRFSYSMSVRIEDAEGNLIFISDTHTPIITRDNPTEDVDVNVVLVIPLS